MWRFNPKSRVRNGNVEYYSSYNGKQFSANTKEKLYQKMKEYITTYDRTGLDLSKMTLAQYWFDWYDHIQISDLSPSTIDNYGYMSKPILDRIGYYKLSKITPRILEKAVE